MGMKLLAIDTSGRFCAACILDVASSREEGRCILDCGKGHAEHLMAVIESALVQSGLDYHELEAVGVCVGPGSFTGIRIGIAVARGLSLALKIPAVGVSSLEAVAAQARVQCPQKKILAAFNTLQGHIQAALFCSQGEILLAPCMLEKERVVELVQENDAFIAGSAFGFISAFAGAGRYQGLETVLPDIGVYAELAAKRTGQEEILEPLYLSNPQPKPAKRGLEGSKN